MPERLSSATSSGRARSGPPPAADAVRESLAVPGADVQLNFEWPGSPPGRSSEGATHLLTTLDERGAPARRRGRLRGKPRVGVASRLRLGGAVRATLSSRGPRPRAKVEKLRRFPSDLRGRRDLRRRGRGGAEFERADGGDLRPRLPRIWRTAAGQGTVAWRSSTRARGRAGASVRRRRRPHSCGWPRRVRRWARCRRGGGAARGLPGPPRVAAPRRAAPDLRLPGPRWPTLSGGIGGDRVRPPRPGGRSGDGERGGDQRTRSCAPRRRPGGGRGLGRRGRCRARGEGGCATAAVVARDHGRATSMRAFWRVSSRGHGRAEAALEVERPHDRLFGHVAGAAPRGPARRSARWRPLDGRGGRPCPPAWAWGGRSTASSEESRAEAAVSRCPFRRSGGVPPRALRPLRERLERRWRARSRTTSRIFVPRRASPASGWKPQTSWPSSSPPPR